MCEKNTDKDTVRKLIAEIRAYSETIRKATHERTERTAALYQACPHAEIVQFFHLNPTPEWMGQPDAFVVRACTTCGMHEEHTVACSPCPKAQDFDTCPEFKNLPTPKKIRHVENYREINQVKLYPEAP